MKPITEAHLAIFRRHMVEVMDVEFDLLADEIERPRMQEAVRAAFLKVPRHRFVPPQLTGLAYQDRPLPIGFDKTTSQPFIAALMVDLLDVGPGDRVLEVGTGLGYQAAVLSELGCAVWSVEVVEEFAAAAAERLENLGYGEVTLRVGDGSRGWADAAPFDAVLVTAAARRPPQALIDQLRPGGRMVLPVGEKGAQRLVRLVKEARGALVTQEIMGVEFTELETVF
jgi:protein-L-isoaspartate(D-aspartate) O-methyltransferase